MYTVELPSSGCKDTAMSGPLGSPFVQHKHNDTTVNNLLHTESNECDHLQHSSEKYKVKLFVKYVLNDRGTQQYKTLHFVHILALLSNYYF